MVSLMIRSFLFFATALGFLACANNNTPSDKLSPGFYVPLTSVEMKQRSLEAKGSANEFISKSEGERLYKEVRKLPNGTTEILKAYQYVDIDLDLKKVQWKLDYLGEKELIDGEISKKDFNRDNSGYDFVLNRKAENEFQGKVSVETLFEEQDNEWVKVVRYLKLDQQSLRTLKIKKIGNAVLQLKLSEVVDGKDIVVETVYFRRLSNVSKKLLLQDFRKLNQETIDSRNKVMKASSVVSKQEDIESAKVQVENEPEPEPEPEPGMNSEVDNQIENVDTDKE